MPHNAFEAFANGATNMIRPVAAIATNLIVFTAFFEFINNVVIWLFSIINISNFGIIVSTIS
jgi:nucleoside permease NupC